MQIQARNNPRFARAIYVKVEKNKSPVVKWLEFAGGDFFWNYLKV